MIKVWISIDTDKRLNTSIIPESSLMPLAINPPTRGQPTIHSIITIYVCVFWSFL